MNDPRFSVTDKTVIVTGASRGIGYAITKGFLESEANVALIARSDSIHELASSFPDRALALPCDLTESDAATRICKSTLARFGAIDVLVNNAGITLPNEDPYSEAAWDRTLDVNLKAAFLLSAAAAEHMKGRGGSIINITSIGAVQGFPGNPSYQAAKGGLRQLTKAMARDWAEHNIRVNTICPGYILTDMCAASYADPQKRAERSARMMLDRWGAPEDLVGPCIFLASNASSYITGCDLPVDGGWTAKGM
jgi:NAD(P)-dependent dehydrogenase (short-subunit alcohol dehydrogenase family)